MVVLDFVLPFFELRRDFKVRLIKGREKMLVTAALAIDPEVPPHQRDFGDIKVFFALEHHLGINHALEFQKLVQLFFDMLPHGGRDFDMFPNHLNLHKSPFIMIK